MGNVTPAAFDSGSGGGKSSKEDVFASVSAVLTELSIVANIAAQIEAAAAGAVNAIEGAKGRANVEILATKLAAIRAVDARKNGAIAAIDAAQPGSGNSAVDESQNHPINGRRQR